jgi:hypothetical protein
MKSEIQLPHEQERSDRAGCGARCPVETRRCLALFRVSPATVRLLVVDEISELATTTGVEGGHEPSSYETVRYLRRYPLHLVENP